MDASELEGPNGFRRRFVENLRRAEIVTLVNAAGSETELAQAFIEELSEVFDAEVAFMIDAGTGQSAVRVMACVGLSPEKVALLPRDPVCARALASGTAEAVRAPELRAIAADNLLLAPFKTGGDRRILVGVARLYERSFDSMEVALIEAVTESAGHALERIWAYEERDRRAAEQLALVRAAKSLNRSLELSEVISTLCDEVRGALRGDKVVASLLDESGDFVVIGSSGLPKSFRGFRQPPGQGLGGRAVEQGSPQVTQAFQEEDLAPRATTAFADVRSAVSVPLRWDERVQGFLALGFTSDRKVSSSDVDLVVGFAELAGLACANASRHQAVREAAEQDALTGCLNQAAFQRGLRAQIRLADGNTDPISLALLDLDGFKTINDAFGHPRGDLVLREVGGIARRAIRGEDLVARYGGDEFAVILPGIDEAGARPVIDRLLTELRTTKLPGGTELSACAGIATWDEEERPARLIERADASLRAAKRSLKPGTIRTSGNPGEDNVAIPRQRRAAADLGSGRDALAGMIGLEIARQYELRAAAEVAASEVAGAAEADECMVVRLVEQGGKEMIAQFRRCDEVAELSSADISDTGSIARCMAERRPVLDTDEDHSAENINGPQAGLTGTGLAVPVLIGGDVWGAIACRGRVTPFDLDDATLIEAVSEHLGTTMRAIELNEQLKRSLIGTAESLAAALEAKDSYTAEHARSIADLAVCVGRQLKLDEHSLEDLRYGAIFHDIGKIAIPDAILNKAGPLDPGEFEVVKKHPVTGEEILAPIPFFAGVRRIVRHDHEHWDGTGYPDGLRGEEIPIGARIVLVADAYHAMVSDRPYRSAMSAEEAIEEIRRCTGTQFDPTVVNAFFEALAAEPAQGAFSGHEAAGLPLEAGGEQGGLERGADHGLPVDSLDR